MRKVTTINLNGTAYQLEEGAYDKLRSYLEGAETKLRANPDRAEILTDLEQSIGDKCDTCLGAHKNVVSEREMDQILREMGPVDGVADQDATAGDASASTGATAYGPPRRTRIYRLPTEGMLGGVCAGWAAYLNVDVVWVRLGFVLLVFFTGVWFVVWLAMLFVMPVADTPDEIAAAHGEPLNAREVIERAKKKSAEFARSARDGDWKRFGEDMKQAGERFGADMRQAGEQVKAGFADASENVRDYSHRLRERARRRAASRYRRRLDAVNASPGARIAAGISLPLLSILSAVLFVAFILTLLNLLTHGRVFGYMPAFPAPLWAVLLMTIVVYGVIAGPISVARREAQRYASAGSRGIAFIGDGLLWTIVVLALLWFAWHYAPALREWARAGFTI